MQKARLKKFYAAGAIVLSAALASGCAATGETPGNDAEADQVVDVSVVLGFIPNVSYGGSWIADDEGIYVDYGVNPTFLAGGPNSPAPEVSIASGEAVLGFEANSSRLFSYLAEADDIVIIGQRTQSTPNGLLSLAANPILEPGDLEGARVIAGAANQSSIEALMTLNDVTDYEFVPGGFDVGPLVNGQGDAMLAFATNQPLVLDQQGMEEGKDYFFTRFSDLNYHLMPEAVIVSRDYLESNRDQVVAFLAATILGWQKHIENPEQAAELAVNEYGVELGLDLEQQIASAKAELPYLTSDYSDEHGIFAIDIEFVQNQVIPSLEAAGIDGIPAADSVIDMSVLEEAYALIEQMNSK